MPNITVQASTAMHEALKLYAKAKSTKHQRITVSDVIVGVLRNAGFEAEDVLEAIQSGKCPEVDVRRRTAATQRDPIERVQEYLISRGCQTAYALSRNLHLTTYDTNRGVAAAIEQNLAAFRPFDRPPIIHWLASCKCKLALPVEIPGRER